MFRHLKTAIDSRRNAKGAFILTGSQKFTLMKGVSESLAGRAAILELEGLTLEEIRSAGIATSPEEAALRGSLPELWGNPELDAKWSEHPGSLDATALVKVAGELPPGSVTRMALICRTGNAYPVKAGVEAVPVEQA